MSKLLKGEIIFFFLKKGSCHPIFSETHLEYISVTVGGWDCVTTASRVRAVWTMSCDGLPVVSRGFINIVPETRESRNLSKGSFKRQGFTGGRSGGGGGREKCQKCLDCVTPDVGSAARRLFNSPAALSPSFERRPLARSLLQEVFGEQLSALLTSGARQTPQPR